VSGWRIVKDDLTSPAVLDLLRLHLEGMHAASPPGSVFAFAPERLRGADVTFWTAWEGDELLGCAALKDLGDGLGEVKSMRTHPDHLRRGVAAALLEHLVGEARARAYRRLSLETGSGPPFDAALALYRRRGFVDGPAFGGYPSTAFNQFLHLDLQGA
jgi:putative acetyltransferase